MSDLMQSKIRNWDNKSMVTLAIKNRAYYQLKLSKRFSQTIGLEMERLGWLETLNAICETPLNGYFSMPIDIDKFLCIVDKYLER